MPSPESNAERIFLQAVENHDSSHWQAFVADACDDDIGLRTRVCDLLNAYKEPNRLLDGKGVAVGIVATASYPAMAEREGTVIGRYKLLQEIGEGGFGVTVHTLGKSVGV